MPLFNGCSVIKGHHDSTKWGCDLRPRRPWGNIEFAGDSRRFETSWFIAEILIWYCIVVQILKGMTLIPRNYQRTCLINVSQVVTILWMLTKHHLFVNRVFISRKKNRSLNLLVTKFVRLFNFLKHDRPIHWCSPCDLNAPVGLGTARWEVYCRTIDLLSVHLVFNLFTALEANTTSLLYHFQFAHGGENNFFSFSFDKIQFNDVKQSHLNRLLSGSRRRDFGVPATLVVLSDTTTFMFSCCAWEILPKPSSEITKWC